MMISLDTLGLHEVAVLGAHCDDVAIGLGGTLLTLASSTPGLRVRRSSWQEPTPPRDRGASCVGGIVSRRDLELTVLDVPDGYAPAYWEPIKKAVEAFGRDCHPDVVFAPHRADAHQDHRMLAELVPTVFRDHLILGGYEILKWENDTPRTSIYHPLTRAVATEKARILLKHYPSQTTHDWFDEDSFLGLSRLRGGVQSRQPHAEAFVLEKATIRFGRT